MAAEASWVVNVEEALRAEEEEGSYLEKRCIYEVPPQITDRNPKAYWPQTVSFGPYHHDKEHLKPMKKHKVRALRHFLKRSRKPFKLFLEALAKVLDDLMACYDPLDQKWHDDRDAFLHLMILDGCFMLEILRMWLTPQLAHDDYLPNDPIFSSHGKLNIMPYVQSDMLMLENQLPMLVLDKLVAVESDGSRDKEFINKLILKFCSPGSPIMRMGKCLHVLDAFRKNLLHEHQSHKLAPAASKSGDVKMHSARELDAAGVQFNPRGRGFMDISFCTGVLSLPTIVVDDTTESTLLNLIAFERLHVGAGKEVSSYVCFMHDIIQNERDVALLRSKEILWQGIGSRAVAELFSSLSKDVTLDPGSSIYRVHKEVQDYCEKPWHKWRANLMLTYFTSPWTAPSLVNAILLFALTVIQTVYTVRQSHSR